VFQNAADFGEPPIYSCYFVVVGGKPRHVLWNTQKYWDCFSTSSPITISSQLTPKEHISWYSTIKHSCFISWAQVYHSKITSFSLLQDHSGIKDRGGVCRRPCRRNLRVTREIENWLFCVFWNNWTRQNFNLTSCDANVPILLATYSSSFRMFSYKGNSLFNVDICYEFWGNIPIVLVVVIAVYANTRENILVAVVLARLVRVCTTQCSSLAILFSNHIVSSLSS